LTNVACLPHLGTMAANENRNYQPETFAGVLHQIDAFIEKHLLCSRHQRTILALWVAHTYCYQHFPVTPYLDISSPEGQSGKTVCLGLLEVLCHNAWKPGGVTAACLTTRIANHQPALLLDDWHTVLRSSGRQPLLGLLKAGTMSGSYYPEYPKEKDWDGLVFCPKAFAGQGRLPASLSTHCIPIVLRRKKHTEKVIAFWPENARSEARELTKSLSAWVEENQEHVRPLACEALSDKRLESMSGPRREVILPLMALAAFAVVRWFKRAMIAHLRIFSAQQSHPSSVALQLLSGIRGFFTQQNDPPKIHTAPLLEYLNGLEDRPWKKLTPNGLRLLLQNFPIHRSSTLRIAGEKLKGFTFQHFVESWESYLPHLASRRLPRLVPDQTQVVADEASVVAEGSSVVANGLSSVPNHAPSVPNLPAKTNNPNVFNNSV